MPVRKISNRGGNTIGDFPSIKMNRMVAFESTIERDKMILADFDPDVQAFEEQPLAIPYKHNNRTVTYTPDLLILTNRKRILVECKPAALVETEDNQRKFNAARSWCEEHGYEFQVVTDEQVRAGFRLTNVKRLTQHARHVVSPQMGSRIYSILQEASCPMTIATLAQKIAPNNPASAMSSILHLAYHHQIALDLDKEKTEASSLVWLPSQFTQQE
jgi:hypothetical protein